MDKSNDSPALDPSGRRHACVNQASTKPAVDPYRFPPGRQLDDLVHRWLHGPAAPTLAAEYSTDDVVARKVERHLRKVSASNVITGTTRIRTPRWFARYEADPSTGTEVFAETYALAVCRLALVWMMEHLPRIDQPHPINGGERLARRLDAPPREPLEPAP